jgi:chitinase
MDGPMNRSRTLLRLAGLALLATAIAGLAPFVSGVPNGSILHALARIGHADTRADWLATTPDAFPLFSLGTLVVYRKLIPLLMTMAPVVLVGMAGVSLLVILQGFAGTQHRRTILPAALVLILLYSLLAGWVTQMVAGIDLRTAISSDPGLGVASGPTFRPETLGLFLLAALAFLVREKYPPAIALAAIPGVFHPAYFLPSLAFLCIGLLLAFRAKKWPLAALATAFAALIPLAFALWYARRTYNLSSYTAPESAASMNFWAPYGEFAVTLVRLSIVSGAAFLLRRHRLFLPFAAAAGIGILAMFSLAAGLQRPDWGVAFIHPAVPIVEAGLAVIAVSVFQAMNMPKGEEDPFLSPGVFWFIAGLLALIGVVRSGLAFTGGSYWTANRLFQEVRESASGEEIYAIPLSLRGFRGATGAATVVDGDALPATAAARSEWESRRKRVDALYAADSIRCGALEQLSTLYGMTRIVIPAGAPPVACPHGDTLFHDNMYTLLRMPGWHRPAGLTAEKHAPWVTGYYGYWGEEEMPPHAMRYDGLTHIVHFFARPSLDATPYFGPVVNKRDSTQLVWGTDHYTVGTYNVTDSLLRYAHRHGVKVVLSLGGIYGGQAEIVDFITKDSTRTQAFVDAGLAFAHRHGYDGVELDWEKPTSGAQVSLIVRRIRAGLDSWPVRGTFIVASAGWDLRLKMYPPALIATAIDQFNIMCYDMHMPGNLIGGEGDATDVTGFNAPLHRTDSTRYPVVYDLSDSYDGYADAAVMDRTGYTILARNRLRFGPRYAVQVMGVPPEKVGLGIPFYGYLYKNKTAPGQPVDGNKPAYVTYKTTRAALKYGGIRNWDEKAMVPWAGGTATTAIWEWGMSLKAGTSFYITYDDPESIRLKVRFARELRLGGVMAYDLWNGWLTDPKEPVRDPLLRSVVEELGRDTSR